MLYFRIKSQILQNFRTLGNRKNYKFLCFLYIYDIFYVFENSFLRPLNVEPDALDALETNYKTKLLIKISLISPCLKNRRKKSLSLLFLRITWWISVVIIGYKNERNLRYVEFFLLIYRIFNSNSYISMFLMFLMFSMYSILRMVFSVQKLQII